LLDNFAYIILYFITFKAFCFNFVLLCNTLSR